MSDSGGQVQPMPDPYRKSTGEQAQIEGGWLMLATVIGELEGVMDAQRMTVVTGGQYDEDPGEEVVPEQAIKDLIDLWVNANPPILRILDDRRPTVVCLCGSTRFAAEFAAERSRLTLAGQIVLGPEVLVRSDPAYSDLVDGSAGKTALDELHKRKIDLADYVLVIDVGGYIGESTRSEIEYAKDRGVPVKYRSDSDDEEEA